MCRTLQRVVGAGEGFVSGVWGSKLRVWVLLSTQGFEAASLVGAVACTVPSMVGLKPHKHRLGVQCVHEDAGAMSC